MQCVLIERFGPPADVVQAAERPEPAPGPGQARVRMHLAPIHNHDLAILRGIYGYKPTLPAVPGTEAVGVIDALGEGTSGLAVGQRVATASVQGTWATHFVADAHRLVPVPESLPDELACQLLAMPLSALMLLVDMKLQPGQWFVQNAANGAVGKTLAALAAQRGIGCVNLVRRDAALAELVEAGLGNGVSTEATDWKSRVRELTGDAPIARAIDSIGGEAALPLTSLLAEGGELISFGALSMKPMLVNGGDLIFKQAVVRGYWATKRFAATPPAELARLIGELTQALAQGHLRLPVASVHDLADAAAAMTAAERPGRAGKVLLRGGA
ncbi:zinc-binding dehydrogenase [Piscinibacter sp.]|uniref:zinc-binding dehydrogenase n=1 Tax=Piscinibacter sp. TaxID=1903157 RepID=UPI002C82D7C1|nr:zinc-binding dehydrogenase [Albitalea sp.]HUG25464.1 zinc-binding dehydrogenase [Albitalea sp.]